MIDVDLWTFPLSLILAIAYLAAIALCWFKQSDSRWLGFVCSRWFSIGCITAVLLLLLVEGTWRLGIFHHVCFVVLVLLMMLPLGLTAIRDIQHKTWGAALCHTGFFVVLWAGLFGAPDMTEAHLKVNKTQPEHFAYTTDAKAVPLPFTLQLRDFIIEYYEDGVAPKQFTSYLLICDEHGEKFVSTSVNHPYRHCGWWIYQSDYDHTGDRFAVLTVVRDPWLPIVYIGFILMVIGAIAETRRAWHSWKVLPVAFAVAVVFGIISLARIHLGTLMPALRSLWFIPHIIIYMVAYSLLAIALILALVSCFSKVQKPLLTELPRKLLITTSALLLIGMLCGAVWAKEAWGQYWTWDAKECWAAVTWMLTLVGTHLPFERKRWVTYVIALAFAAMQITWYGVNYLPSAQYSMHTYNQ